MSAIAVKVRALEWTPTASGYGIEAPTILGKYWIRDGQFWSPGCSVSRPYRTDEDAKKGAQADFERNILSTLEPVSDPRLAMAREALEFYAAPGSWQWDIAPDPAGSSIPGTSPADIDGGERARATLTALEEGK